MSAKRSTRTRSKTRSSTRGSTRSRSASRSRSTTRSKNRLSEPDLLSVKDTNGNKNESSPISKSVSSAKQDKTEDMATDKSVTMSKKANNLRKITERDSIKENNSISSRSRYDLRPTVRNDRIEERVLTTTTPRPSDTCYSCPLVYLFRPLIGMFLLPFGVYWANFYAFNGPVSGESNSTWGESMEWGNSLWSSDQDTYLNKHVFMMTLTYILLVHVFSYILPIGKSLGVVAGGRRVVYCNNSLAVLVALSGVAYALEFKMDKRYPDFKLSSWYMDNYPAIMTSLLIQSLSAGILSAIKAYYFGCVTNVVRPTGFFLYNIYMGKETRPDLFGLHAKVITARPGVFLLLFHCGVLLMDHAKNVEMLSPSFIFGVAALSTIILDYCVFEHILHASHEVTNTGFGILYFITNWFFIPFFHSINATYYYKNPDLGKDKDGHCDILRMTAASAIFLSGYFIKRLSSNEKFAFKTDPNDDQFKDMKKIPTPTGRKLLAGGWWGWLRHPDYYGDLLMVFSLGFPAIFKSNFVWAYPLTILTMTLVKVYEAESVARERKGIAWQHYSRVVPLKVIPRVF